MKTDIAWFLIIIIISHHSSLLAIMPEVPAGATALKIMISRQVVKRQITCNPVCENGGLCNNNNTCTCIDGFQGPSCALRLTDSCTNDTSLVVSPILFVTFNAGTPQYSSQTPSDFHFITTHNQVFSGHPNDGQFAFVNAIPNTGMGFHAGAIDHTPNDTNGYMMLVNAAFSPSEFYRSNITSLILGHHYQLSVYMANANRAPINGDLPNIKIRILSMTSASIAIAELITGPLAEYSSLTWSQHTLTFLASESSVILSMYSIANGGYGNDFVVDDIEIRDTCSIIDNGGD